MRQNRMGDVSPPVWSVKIKIILWGKLLILTHFPFKLLHVHALCIYGSLASKGVWYTASMAMYRITTCQIRTITQEA